jgi:arginyl-tRNA synthetase
LHSPQDIFHVYLAERLRALVGCEASVAYDAVDALNSIDMGDLVVVSPRLRVKDINAKDLVIDLASKVRL